MENNIKDELIQIRPSWYIKPNQDVNIWSCVHPRFDKHDGMLLYYTKSQQGITVAHKNIFSYYNYSKDTQTSIGNTAALMMVNRNTFVQVGMFNEGYVHNFEDVELNLNLVIRGFENYLLGSHPAYHYENKSRHVEATKNEIIEDYNNFLIPFIQKNIKKLGEKIFFKQ